MKPAEQTPLTTLRLGELARRSRISRGSRQHCHGRSGDRKGDRRTSRHRQDRLHRFDRRRKRNHARRRRHAQARDARTWRQIARTSFSPTPMSTPPSRAPSTASFTARAKSATQARGSSSNASCRTNSSRSLVGAPRKCSLADPLDPKTRLGAIVSQEQMQTVLGYIEAGKKEAAKLIAGGNRVLRSTAARDSSSSPRSSAT